MKNYFSGSRKYFSFLIITLILILAAGILQPVIVQNKNDNWNSEVSQLSAEIESSVIQNFKLKEKHTQDFADDVADSVAAYINNRSYGIERLFNFIGGVNDFYNIQIFENDSLLAWNSNAVLKYFDRSEFANRIGQSFFYETNLIIYFSHLTRIDANGRSLFLFVSCPIEKKYDLINKYYVPLSWQTELTEKYLTEFNVYYTSNAQFSADGRKHSCELINSNGYKIGVVTFQKPSLSFALNEIQNTFYKIQSALGILAFLFLGMVFRRRVSSISNKYVRFMFIAVYLAALRVILFLFEFPNTIIKSELTNSAYFSSVFANGIVRSPFDFLITVSLFLLICFAFFRSAVVAETDSENPVKPSWYKFVIGLIIIIPIYLLILRGLGASIRSVIFDSTLRYFRDPDLIPELPAAVMHLNVLMLGFCSLLVTVALVYILYKYSPVKYSLKGIYLFLFIFLLFQSAGFLFDYFQKQPQGTPIIRIIFVLLTFLFVYLLIAKRTSRFQLYLYFAFAASFVTVYMLNFYNSELEKESLKTTAFELIRPNENLLEFIVTEALMEADQDNNLYTPFDAADPNFEASAFKIWSNSVLQGESIGCEVNFRNHDHEYLGGFSIKFDNVFRADPNNLKAHLNGLQNIYHDQSIYRDAEIVRGVMPVKMEDDLLGYLEISVLYDINLLSGIEVPPFLSNRNSMINNTVDFDKLIILEFSSDRLIDKISSINISQPQIELMTSADLSQNNEAWLNLKINDEDYRFYLLKTDFEETKILAVGLKEKDVSWNLFEFFKIFFVHSLIILLTLLATLIIRIRKFKDYRLTFRGQLLIAFLFVSIVPMVLLAVYFRDLTEEKSMEAIFYKLGKRAVSVEEYINSYLHSTVNLNTLIEKAAFDLKIDFSIYKKGGLVYSSEQKYFDIGLMNEQLNPIVYNKFENEGILEFVASERIENYKYHSFYYKGYIGGSEYIFVVSDIFNTILIPFSDVELDIFLFGIYSLAVILIILISTILANQISSPISELTIATKSVASGDLSIELDENKTGELKIFVKGFNSMVKQLKRSQAELAELERETAWKEMAKQVAHEIKNPLTPMKLSIQQLIAAKKDGSPKFDSIFEKVTATVIDQIETLKNIASEFSSFARMPGLKVEDIDLVKVCDETINLFSQEKIKLVFSSDLRTAVIAADYDQMKRSLINLIRNSIQADASNISLSLKKDNDFYLLTITDDGDGIPAEIMEKVFDENFTTKVHGMGLGLAMVKRSIENVGGTVKIETSSSAGTTITLKLISKAEF